MWYELVDNRKRHAQQSYSFNIVLERYLKEKLRIEKLKTEADLPGNKLSKNDLCEIRANDKNKVKVLDNHIFRSMANLVYFFEFINKHPELEGVFDDDVEDLFGLRGTHVKRHKVEDGKYLVFLRFLDAVLGYDGNDVIVEERDGKTYTDRRVKKSTIRKTFDTSRNIRLQLISAIADATLQCIQNIAGEKEGNTLSVAHMKIYKIIAQDLERTSIWKDYYCNSQIKLNLNNPHRKIGF